jgi:hypothetical protein
MGSWEIRSPIPWDPEFQLVGGFTFRQEKMIRLFSPRLCFKLNRVLLEWAMIFPPMGLSGEHEGLISKKGLFRIAERSLSLSAKSTMSFLSNLFRNLYCKLSREQLVTRIFWIRGFAGTIQNRPVCKPGIPLTDPTSNPA